jgi:hypothetical protein
MEQDADDSGVKAIDAMSGISIVSLSVSGPGVAGFTGALMVGLAERLLPSVDAHADQLVLPGV